MKQTKNYIQILDREILMELMSDLKESINSKNYEIRKRDELVMISYTDLLELISLVNIENKNILDNSSNVNSILSYKDLLTDRELMECFSISKSTLYRSLEKGEIPGVVYAGGRRRYSVEAIKQYLNRQLCP